jgi:branched-chain amino acid transport system permease protein
MIANLIVGGLAAGCLYAMVGIAIVIVLNITDIANFAQGEMAMVTTFFAYWLLDSVGLSWWQAAFPSPFAFSPPFMIGTVPVSVDSVVNIAAGLAIVIAMTWFLRFTWIGLGLRAASQNPTVARMMGVSISRTSAIAWGLGGLVGGISGILVAPSLFLDTNLMGALLIKAFAGGVLGGLHSLIGVFLGCLALGVAENLVGAYLSPAFGEAITFIIIIAVLIVRPEGIFGRVKARKV